jgi:hypothetical protein
LKHYRALFSMPIEASSDADAMRLAGEQAHRLLHPGGGVAGHVEMLAEVQENGMEMLRVVEADPWLLRQLPADWKP